MLCYWSRELETNFFMLHFIERGPWSLAKKNVLLNVWNDEVTPSRQEFALVIQHTTAIDGVQ